MLEDAWLLFELRRTIAYHEYLHLHYFGQSAEKTLADAAPQQSSSASERWA